MDKRNKNDGALDKREHNGRYISFKDSGLGTVFFECMKKYHNRIFQYIADTDETDTYGEILKRSIRTAIKLREKGITKDDIISSCSYNHKNNAVPLIASLFIGTKMANFDPNLSHLDAVNLMKLIKPKIIFISTEALSFMEKCLEDSKVDTEIVVFGDSKNYSNFSEFLEPQPEEDSFEPLVTQNVRDTAFIMFSSGTTGLPKGICLSHYGLLGHNSNNNEVWSNTKDSVMLNFTTFYWISAVIMIIKVITDGCARVVCSRFDAVNTWRVIEKYKVSSIFLAPYHARDFLAAYQKDVDTSSLKSFLTGSAPVTVDFMKKLSLALPYSKVVQGYGQTEACGFISVFDINNPRDVELQTRNPLSCGRILPVYTWKVVDPNTEKKLGPNERGEFRYKTDYQMNGYYKLDSMSAYDSEGFIKSGDIVYYDDDGCLFIVDRIKEMFKYKGWHILPAVLEGVLMTHPAVKEAVVIGVPHELDGDLPMGLVVLNKGHEDVKAKDIERYMEKRVSDSQRLRAGIKFVDSILKTATGKVQRNEMKKSVLNGLVKSTK